MKVTFDLNLWAIAKLDALMESPVAKGMDRDCLVNTIILNFFPFFSFTREERINFSLAWDKYSMELAEKEDKDNE